jgi:hypothetical protein
MPSRPSKPGKLRISAPAFADREQRETYWEMLGRAVLSVKLGSNDRDIHNVDIALRDLPRLGLTISRTPKGLVLMGHGA